VYVMLSQIRSEQHLSENHILMIHQLYDIKQSNLHLLGQVQRRQHQYGPGR